MTERTTLEIIAPTVEEALSQGLAQLGLPANAVSVEVLDSGNKGLFGLGGRQVRVRLTVNVPGQEPTQPAVSAPEKVSSPQVKKQPQINRQTKPEEKAVSVRPAKTEVKIAEPD